MTGLGIAITAATAAVLITEYYHHRRTSFSPYGWIGIVALVTAEALMFRGIEPIATYFTPIAWTAYLLLTDAAVLAITGRSRLHDEPRQFVAVAALSIPLWLIFEAYNLRLANWTYVGVPVSLGGAFLGYGWSFATITPAIFETADLIEAFGHFKPGRALRFSATAQWVLMLCGAACLVLPWVLPRRVAAYLFALVWVGFVLLLEPINRRASQPSLLGDLAEGRWGRFWSLLAAGWVCGWLWEFWNYWASAKWHYVFPMFQGWKIFEMPAPGYLGFLPFALECFAMYVAAAGLLKRIAGRDLPRIAKTRAAEQERDF